MSAEPGEAWAPAGPADVPDEGSERGAAGIGLELTSEGRLLVSVGAAEAELDLEGALRLAVRLEDIPEGGIEQEVAGLGLTLTTDGVLLVSLSEEVAELEREDLPALVVRLEELIDEMS